MPQVLLKAVLMALIALPHGICFCHHAAAASSLVDSECCDAQEQTPPAEMPDDDADCPCCKRPIPASSPQPIEVQRDEAIAFLLMNDAAVATTDGIAGEPNQPFMPCRGPVPLILCALRI